jgi:hypothetical protein
MKSSSNIARQFPRVVPAIFLVLAPALGLAALHQPAGARAVLLPGALNSRGSSVFHQVRPCVPVALNYFNAISGSGCAFRVEDRKAMPSLDAIKHFNVGAAQSRMSGVNSIRTRKMLFTLPQRQFRLGPTRGASGTGSELQKTLDRMYSVKSGRNGNGFRLDTAMQPSWNRKAPAAEIFGAYTGTSSADDFSDLDLTDARDNVAIADQVKMDLFKLVSLAQNVW